jgi:outer membrane protein
MQLTSFDDKLSMSRPTALGGFTHQNGQLQREAQASFAVSSTPTHQQPGSTEEEEMDKEMIVSLVSATLLSVTPVLHVLPFAQEAGENVLRFSTAYGATPSLLQGVHFSAQGTFARIVFELQENAPYRILPGKDPSTILVEFPGVDRLPSKDVWRSQHSLIQEVRFVEAQTKVMAQIKLTQPGDVHRHFPMSAPPRIVLDLVTQPSTASTQPATPVAAAPRAHKIAVVTPGEQTPPPAGQSTPLQTVPTAPRKQATNPQPASPMTAPPEKPLRQEAQGSTDKSRPTGSSPHTASGQPRRALAQAQSSQPEKPRPLQRPSSTLSLTLEQSIELALQRNLRLQIATLSRDAVSYEVPRAKALFHPTVGASFLASGEKLRPERAPAVDSNTQSVTPFISQLVPTGATVIVSNDFSRQEIEQETPPRTYESAVTASVVQPLLRGGWLTVTTRPIQDAEFNVRIEEARLRAEILRIVAQAKSAYYTAILHENIIAITEEAIQRDKTLIESSQALFQAGLVTKRDVFSAEVILSKDLAQLANAQADLAVAKNALLDVLGISIATDVDLLDKDLSFQPLLLEPELAQWIAAAISNRPEVLETEERLGQNELNIRVARNTTLPQLDLVATYGKPHTALTFGRSLELRGDTWSAGLVVSVPIGNVAARSVLTQAKIEQKRLQQEQGQLKRQIELEVRTAVIKLRRSVELIRVRSIGIEQAKGKLEVAQARFALGQADNFDITDAQQDLLEAQTDLLTATADYNIGLAELEASIAGPITSSGATP